jgi:hypothetical protein
MMRYVLATPHRPRYGEAMLRMDAGRPAAILGRSFRGNPGRIPHGNLRLPAKTMAAITRARRMPSHGTLMTRIVGCIAALSLRTDGRAERSAAW